jgi:hypothetical protein
LDQAEGRRVWAAANADPAARAVLDALEAVRTGLGELGSAPVPPMPAQFAARLDAALDAEVRNAFGVSVAPPPARAQGQHAESQTLAPVVDLAEARRKRTRMAAWGGGLLTAAAAAVAIAVAVVPTSTTGGVPNAMPPSEQTQGPGQAPGAGEGPLAVSRGNLAAAVGQVGNAREYGDLRDQAGLDRCLTAAGVTPGSVPVAGVKPVSLDGTRGTMAILLPELGKFRILVFGSGCAVVTDTTIGR